MKKILILIAKLSITTVFIALFISFFQWFSHEVIHYSELFLEYNYWIVTLIIILTTLFSIVIININNKYKGYLGSGVPQFEAYFDHNYQFSSVKMLILITINSFFAYFSGFILGGEGPSITTAGAIGKSVNEMFKSEDKELVEASCSAGFACAFLAPVAGFCHLIEENKKHLTFSLLLKGLFIIFISSLITYFVYPHNLLPNKAIVNLPFNLYYSLIFVVLYILMFSYLFKKSILLTKDLNKKYNFMIYLTPILVIVFMLLRKFYPIFVGSGSIILSTDIYDMFLVCLVGLLIVRLIFSGLSANANVSGGIVLPMLAIGALGGEIIVNVISKFDTRIVDYNQVLKICTMVGVFAVVTNCPLTALVLGLKMGEFSVVILPLTIVLVTLYFILKLTKHHSIYKDLVKRLPNLEVH